MIGALADASNVVSLGRKFNHELLSGQNRKIFGYFCQGGDLWKAGSRFWLVWWELAEVREIGTGRFHPAIASSGGQQSMQHRPAAAKAEHSMQTDSAAGGWLGSSGCGCLEDVW